MIFELVSDRCASLIMSSRRRLVSEDIRQLAVNKVFGEGKSKREVSRIIEIPESTVRYIVKCYQERESVQKRNSGGSLPRKFTDEIKERIVRLINDENLYTLADIVHHLGIDVHQATVWKWLKNLNFSWKITRPIPEKRNTEEVKLERIPYIRWYQSYSPHQRYSNIIYVDESPFNLHIIKTHAWSRVGTTPNPVVSNSRGNNVTMILAINCINIVSSSAIIHTGVNSLIFKEFLNNLVSILGTESEFTIVMDNVRFHHVDEEFKDSYPYEIKYLPRYSPFLNPCEETFSKLKNSIRREGRMNGTNDLLQRMENACRTIVTQDLSNYILHTESFFNDCLEMRDIARE